ncbi:MAG: BrnA antitoxin family protein [Proteobacteria bacterium]|nr:BrnA antitoxin family protein [Pseudomonadota bacterium]
MIAKKRATRKNWVDPDDAPELTDEFFERADEYRGRKKVRRGRPKSAAPKLPVKLRLDPDLVAALRATGEGWQTRVNDTLRATFVLSGRL